MYWTYVCASYIPLGVKCRRIINRKCGLRKFICKHVNRVPYAIGLRSTKHLNHLSGRLLKISVFVLPQSSTDDIRTVCARQVLTLDWEMVGPSCLQCSLRDQVSKLAGPLCGNEGNFPCWMVRFDSPRLTGDLVSYVTSIPNQCSLSYWTSAGYSWLLMVGSCVE